MLTFLQTCGKLTPVKTPLKRPVSTGRQANQ